MSERERFEKWIKNHRSCTSREIWQAAIQAERERCAKIAEGRIQCDHLCEQCGTAKGIADAIRRGGEHEHNE